MNDEMIEFEIWILSEDVDPSALDKVVINNESVYFFNGTKMLFKQFLELKKLRAMIENGLGFEDLQQDSMKSHLN